MGNYEQLKQAISDAIKTNGNQEITGAIMQNALLTIISTVGDNATFAGIATPTTNPGTPDQNVFYIASKPGIYVNFGGIIVNDEVLILYNNDGIWNKENAGLSTYLNVKYLEQNIDTLSDSTIKKLYRQVGAVYASNGEVGDFATNNFWADIPIPEGATKVKYQMFKSSSIYGIAFLDTDGVYISGYFNTTEDTGTWKTIEIPSNATTFRFCYVTDIYAEQNQHPKFEYIIFNNLINLTTYRDRPNSGCHSFSVKVNITIPQLTSNDSNTIQSDYVEGTDYGFIMLPKNYSANGNPTRLIIVCHGAGANLDDYKSNEWKETSQTYWTNFGYAIMDMYANPPELSGSNSELHYGNPIVLQCYIKGIDYVMKNFNLKKDGIFVVGSSMGGLSSFQIVQSGCFNVLAQIGNCPCIDIFKQAYCNPWVDAIYQRSKISEYFGFEGEKPTFTNQKPPTQEEIDYFKNNFDKVIGYYPILKDVVSGDINTIFDAIPNNVNVLEDEQEKEIYNKFTNIYPCPIKIFHCKDDTTVVYRYSEYFINMVRRSGQLAYFRPFAIGGHAAWDAGDDITIHDIFGDNITLSASKYESYLFFNRFDN